jgi:hypothetical protein
LRGSSIGSRQFPADEERDPGQAAEERGKRDGGCPAVVGSFDRAEHERDQRGDRDQRADRVEAGWVKLPCRGDDEQRSEQGERGQGDVEGEDRRPGEEVK